MGAGGAEEAAGEEDGRRGEGPECRRAPRPGRMTRAGIAMGAAVPEREIAAPEEGRGRKEERGGGGGGRPSMAARTAAAAPAAPIGA